MACSLIAIDTAFRAKTIVFIDSGVDDRRTLMAGIPESAEVVVLEAGHDGIAQMARALVGRSEIESLHIISHGAPGRLYLGTATLDGASIDRHRAALAVIGAALAPDGAILLYGCEVARGAAGAAFVAAFAEATNADVAASETLTGAATLGGDWDLSMRVGSVRAQTLRFDGYQGVLTDTAPTLTATVENSGFTRGSGSVGFDLFDTVSASTQDSGQTFAGLVLTVHNVSGSNEFLTIGSTDVALTAGTTGSFSSGNYAVTVANDVATVTLSGMSLSDVNMAALIDGISYKHTGSAGSATGLSTTRSIVLRSITDSGTTNTTEINRVATVTMADTPSTTFPITITPVSPTVTFTPGTPQLVEFTVLPTSSIMLIGATVSLAPVMPSGWSYTDLSSASLTGIITSGVSQTLSFKVSSAGSDTSGVFPISIVPTATGINLTTSAISSSVMVTLGSSLVAGTPDLIAGSDSGSSSTDDLTNVSSPAFTGSATASATVVLYDGATAVGTTTASGAGAWTITSASLADGAHTLTATAADTNSTSSASSALTVTVDTTAPTLSSAVVNGSTLTLTYAEALDGASDPAGSAYAVSVGGTPVTVTAADASGSTVTLTLATAVTQGQTVTLDYTVPGTTPVQDAAGNSAAALTAQAVTNRTPLDPNFILYGTSPFGLADVAAIPVSVLVDVDGDGDLDALVGNSFGNTVFFRNNGTTLAPTFSLEGSNPFGLANVDGYAAPVLKDLDGDGDLDALIGEGYGNTLFFRNNGTSGAPTFSREGTNLFGLANVGEKAAPVLVDIDGDGDLDALIGNTAGNTVFFRNTGTTLAPTFSLVGTNPFGLADVGSYAKPALADVDGDGDLDALIGSLLGNTLFFRNTGTSGAPTFSLEGTHPFGLASVGTRSNPTLADLDGDGDLDAVIGNTAGNIVVFLNAPPPPSAPTGLDLVAASDSGTSSTDDLTNVTSPAITGTVGEAATVVLYDGATAIGTTTASGAGAWTITSASLSDAVHTLAAKAITENGTSAASTALSVTVDTTAPVLSSAVVNGSTLTLTYAETLDGASDPAGSAYTVTAGGSPVTVTAADANGSTVTLTLATAVTRDQTVTVGYAVPGATPVQDAAGNGAAALTAQAVTNRTPQDPSFSLFGTNPFGLANVVGGANPALVDVDGDGDLDALLGTFGGDTVFFRNTGSASAPSFTLADTNPFGLVGIGNRSAPTLVDLDGDGDLDALIGTFGGDTVVFRNTGTTLAPTFSLVGTNPFGLADVGDFAKPALADVDGDGDLDALVGDASSRTLFFRNTGTTLAPTFTLAGTNPFGLAGVGDMSAPALADFDGDGDLDALIGNYDGNTVVFRNTGTTTAPTFTLVGTNPFGLAGVGASAYAAPTLVDVDGDGDLDALVGNISGGTIVFLNGVALPAAPTGLDLPAASDSGSSNTDDITKLATPAITGTVNTAATVILYDGLTAVGTATASGAGAWTITPASLSDAAHTLTATATTSSGTSTASSALTVTVDTVAPTAPTGLDLAAGSNSGLTTDTITSTVRPAITGTVAEAATVILYDGLTAVGTATASGAGMWTVTSASLADGNHTLTAAAVDTAGNTSSASSALTITIDTTAPTLSTLSPTDDATGVGITQDFVLTFSEAMKTGNDTLELSGTSTATMVESFAGTDAQVTVSGSQVTINPNTTLNYSTGYYLEITSGAFTDLAGNLYEGLSGSAAYNFTTEAAPQQQDDPTPTPTTTTTSETVDGMVVQQTTQTATDGTVTQTLSVPIVTETRTEQNASTTNADIPLVKDATTGASVLEASLPVGVGLQVESTTASGSTTTGQGLAGLIRAIQNRTQDQPEDQGKMTDVGTVFLSALPTNVDLTVRTIIPVVAQGTTTAPSAPIIITGTPTIPATGGGGSTSHQQQAIVIDVRNLPKGTVIQLQNVEFAAIVGDVRVGGGEGSQVVVGDSGNQYIVLGADDDTLRGGGGNDFVGSEGGDDQLWGDEGYDTVTGGIGNDALYGNQQDDLLYGNQQSDTLFGGQDQDTLFGGQDGDALYGNRGADRLYGNLGDDSLFGGQGDDVLYGGQGNDVLAGNLGADTLYGGLGADIFRIGATQEGGDVIVDFETGVDTIAVVGPNFGTLQAGRLSASHFALDNPTTADTVFVFNTTTKTLSFDADGSGAGVAVTLATLNVRTLSASDILVLGSGT